MCLLCRWYTPKEYSATTLNFSGMPLNNPPPTARELLIKKYILQTQSSLLPTHNPLLTPLLPRTRNAEVKSNMSLPNRFVSWTELHSVAIYTRRAATIKI